MVKDLQVCLLVLMLGSNNKGQRAKKYDIETVHGTVPTYLDIINIQSIPTHWENVSISSLCERFLTSKFERGDYEGVFLG